MRHEVTSGRGLVFQRPSGAVVKLSPEALARMLHFRQFEAHQAEAGGVLLGRLILGCDDVVIDEATCPMPGDFGTPSSFFRDKAYHQRIIDERWRSSEGTCLYLGEWHTHPESHPVPSRVDLVDWFRHLQMDQFSGPSLFFIIVGTHAVHAWEGIRGARKIALLQSVVHKSG